VLVLVLGLELPIVLGLELPVVLELDPNGRGSDSRPGC
jgi:hypothetical protein